jgi:tripartite-type tricarboxylate transporter receptor subunit TctC
MPSRRTLLKSACVTAAAFNLPRPAFAQTAVDTLRLIVGFPPVGTTDAMARCIADKLRGVYAKNVLVDNKPGAAGQLGITDLIHAPADGSSALLTPESTMAIYPYTYTKLPYKASDTLAVSMVSSAAVAFGIAPTVPTSVRNLSDFIEWVKADPSDARRHYGSSSAGSMAHMVGALFDKTTGLNMTHIPYKGSGPSITDLLGGQISILTTPVGDLLRYPTLRILATTGKQRLPFTPDVATFSEQGFADLTMEEWYGFFMPLRTPQAVANRLHEALRDVMRAKDVIDFAYSVGHVPRTSSSTGDFAKTVQTSLALWREYVPRVGFKADV